MTEGPPTINNVIALARRLSPAEKAQVIEELIQDIKAVLPQHVAARKHGGDAPSPEEVQQMRDEIFHDF